MRDLIFKVGLVGSIAILAVWLHAGQQEMLRRMDAIEQRIDALPRPIEHFQSSDRAVIERLAKVSGLLEQFLHARAPTEARQEAAPPTSAQATALTQVRESVDRILSSGRITAEDVQSLRGLESEVSETQRDDLLVLKKKIAAAINRGELQLPVSPEFLMP